MKFEETPIPGAFLLELEEHRDDRGFFARSFCQREFQANGLDPLTAQCNISYNEAEGTLRGLHLQNEAHPEAKLVRCTAGSIFDVIVDLRPKSPACLTSWSVTLSAGNRRQLYVPAGVAHGFLTLEPKTEIFYQMSTFYVPDAQIGYRWDDPSFGIEWPAEIRVISDRDRELPYFAS